LEKIGAENMPLPSQDKDRVESFRAYIEDTVATDDRYGEAVRADSDAVLATRFFEGASCWFEVAVLPGDKKVRVGFFTNDPAINTECEQVIAESGETAVRFVGQAFEEAGLEWPNPEVEHGKDAAGWSYATPVKIDEFIDLDSDEIRDKTVRMLDGYLIAFGPAIGPEEE
jgi:hypothetical protein